MALFVDAVRNHLVCCGRTLSIIVSKLLVNWMLCYAYFSRLLQMLKKMADAAGKCPPMAFLEGCAPQIQSDNSPAAENGNRSSSTVVHKSSSQSKGCLLFHFREEDLRRIFRGLDGDGDGMVSANDIQRLLQNLGLHCNKNIISHDDEQYFVNFDDFCSLCLPLLDETEEDLMMEAFSVFDKNGDGFITHHDLQQILLSLGFDGAHDLELCQNMIKKFDSNFDGSIDFLEFQQMITAMDQTP